MMSSIRDFYTVLGVEPNVTQEELKGMYHKLAKKYHADANSEDPKLRKWSHEMMVELNDAYSILKDPNKREEYDQQMGQYDSGNPNTQFNLNIVYIRTLEEGKKILAEGVDSFPFGPLPLGLLEECRSGAKKIINRRPHQYLRLGIPNEYPMAYLASAVENIVETALETSNEKYWRDTIVGQLFITGTFIISVIGAFRLADNFLKGIALVSGTVIIQWLLYRFFSWIARFIARGFKSNLVGFRGLLVNGLIAFVIIVLLILGTFF